VIQKNVRKIDTVARYGGEEFAIILPQTSLKGAFEEAERIRKLLLCYCYSGLASERITMSIGVASYPDGGINNAGDIVNLADKALYEAKSAGKNCVKMRA